MIRHHPTPDAGSPSSAIGIAASDAILDQYLVTLYLFGHVHEYAQIGPNRVVTGNAGAPLDAGQYGYLFVLQRPDGNIQATEYQLNATTSVDFARGHAGPASRRCRVNPSSADGLGPWWHREEALHVGCAAFEHASRWLV